MLTHVKRMSVHYNICQVLLNLLLGRLSSWPTVQNCHVVLSWTILLLVLLHMTSECQTLHDGSTY